MNFRDPIAYLVIKNWIKFKLSKYSCNQRLVSKNWKNSKKLNFHKKEKKKKPKKEAQNQAQITENNLAWTQFRNSMLFAQPYYNWLYLPHFNSE